MKQSHIFALEKCEINHTSVSPTIILGGRPTPPTAPPAPIEGQVNLI